MNNPSLRKTFPIGAQICKLKMEIFVWKKNCSTFAAAIEQQLHIRMTQ